jgi:putative flippase GtrA
MLTFLKANISSLIASLMDFAIFTCCVEIFKMPTVVAGVIGVCCGGLINFFIGRGWVFQSKEGKMNRQAFRYLLVWTGNMLLNVGGIYLAIDIAGLPAMAGKIVVSLLVACAYNYPLQKRYVFYNN